MKLEEFNTLIKRLNTDKEKWIWVIANRDIVKIGLDNDETWIWVTIDSQEDLETITLDSYIGDSKGIRDLLDVMVLQWEQC